MRIYKYFLFLCCFVFVLAAQAQPDAKFAKESLQIIAEFANLICANPDYQGSNTSVRATAGAKAELSKLLKKLADANVELEANVKKESFQGLLQKDLLEATKAASQCRLKIYDDLKDRLLTKSAPIFDGGDISSACRS